MKNFIFLFILIFVFATAFSQEKVEPGNIKFSRQAVKRFIFDESQAIQLAGINPENVIGLSVMHPIETLSGEKATIRIENDELKIESDQASRTEIWFGGFNPFATYTIDLKACAGKGAVGFAFTDSENTKQMIVSVTFDNEKISDAKLLIKNNSNILIDRSVAVNLDNETAVNGKLILQMLGSGFVLYIRQEGLPKVIAQADFNSFIDLRNKEYIYSFQSKLYVEIIRGQVIVGNVRMELSTGTGSADIRAITYENGDPILDRGRLWYTISIRGRALPHHIQGIFSLDPTVFDLKLEGVVVFDRNDGLLRNEIASHIFFDRKDMMWRGITTGFSAYANPEKEKKQLLAIESKKDPRFGFSVMTAEPFGIVGDIEDPHVIYDEDATKWRILTCENTGDGYKAVLLESDYWNKDYKKIAGPVAHNSTGTSIQKINGKRFCFSGSGEREIFVYNYPDLSEAGTIKMDLPPWDDKSNTRIWPNIVQLPEGYPFKYVALMMDRFNYPGLKGPNWTYGALYLYHGN